MITFETQEDFEKAVLDLIKRRLRISVGRDCGEKTVALSIHPDYYPEDNTPHDDEFTSAWLPSPSIQY